MDFNDASLCECDAKSRKCRKCGVLDLFCGSPRACPAPRIATATESPTAPARGPGTELKKLLARVGIVATPDCSCNARAAEMDRREQEKPGWCEDNLDTIVGWLREQAHSRGLPFVDMAGRMLVRRAIRNARNAVSPDVDR